MRNYQKLLVFSIFAVLLISQISFTAFGHHNDNAGKKAREAAKPVTAKVDAEKLKERDELKAAFDAYKTAFKEWKIASENYKAAKIAGVQDTIDSTKIILEQELLDKNIALKAYKDAIKEFNEKNKRGR